MVSQRGLSGTKSEPTRNSTEGTAQAANIQRQPCTAFQDAANSAGDRPSGTGRAMHQFTNCAASTPMTIVSWLMATSRPRRAGGAISEMYIGEILEARPMLTPPRIRQVTNAGKLCVKAMPMEEATKFAAARISIGLRPKRSLSAPEASAPARHPRSAQLCAQPVGEMAFAFTFAQKPASCATSAAVSLRWKKAS